MPLIQDRIDGTTDSAAFIVERYDNAIFWHGEEIGPLRLPDNLARHSHCYRVGRDVLGYYAT